MENGLALLTVYKLQNIENIEIESIEDARKTQRSGTEAKSTVVEILSKYSISVPPSLFMYYPLLTKCFI